MIWLLFAFLTAFFQSLIGVFSKRSASKIDEYVVTWGAALTASVVLLPVAFWLGVPALSAKFWFVLGCSVLLNGTATLLFVRALKLSDLSLSGPLIALTPVFMLITSPIIVREFPSWLGVAGILVAVIGAYLLNVQDYKKGVLQPFRALFRNRGSRIMLLVAVIWSLTSNIDKVGVGLSAPVFWSFSVYTGVLCMFTLYFLVRRKSFMPIRDHGKHVALVGIVMAASSAAQMIAITMTLAVYVIAIKRFSAVLAVLWGWLLFREKGTRTRLVGALIMVAGVALIAFS